MENEWNIRKFQIKLHTTSNHWDFNEEHRELRNHQQSNSKEKKLPFIRLRRASRRWGSIQAGGLHAADSGRPRALRRGFWNSEGKCRAPQSPTASQTNNSLSSGKSKVTSTLMRSQHQLLSHSFSFLQMACGAGDEPMAECGLALTRPRVPGSKPPVPQKDKKKKMCKTRKKTWDWEIYLSDR